MIRPVSGGWIGRCSALSLGQRHSALTLVEAVFRCELYHSELQNCAVYDSRTSCPIVGRSHERECQDWPHSRASPRVGPAYAV